MGALYGLQEIQEWTEFEEGLRIRNRYVPPDTSYFASLLDGCLRRRATIPPGTSIFRSRIMPLDRSVADQPLTSEEMGPPPTTTATGGRLNPEGISCLYTALEEETAVAEIRPWPQARLTLAEFKTQEQLEVLDLTPAFRGQDTPVNYRMLLVASLIARPVHREDRFGYLGTQYLAEALKARAVRGLLYQSSLRTDGRNLAIFSDIKLAVEGTKLIEVRSVSYSYGPPSGPPVTR